MQRLAIFLILIAVCCAERLKIDIYTESLCPDTMALFKSYSF